VQKKYSLDKEEEYREYRNFDNFSNFIEERFLNFGKAFNTTNSLPCEGELNNAALHSSLSFCASTDFNSDNQNEPNSPTSFGFRHGPSRQANVSIRRCNEWEHFSGVGVFLVNDSFDEKRAGLLFKFENTEVDLKILKSEGMALEKHGELRAISCHLWVDQEGEWVPVEVTITLLPQSS
jgi:hypothetical protein